jgi:hypothetical protein
MIAIRSVAGSWKSSMLNAAVFGHRDEDVRHRSASLQAES